MNNDWGRGGMNPLQTDPYFLTRESSVKIGIAIAILLCSQSFIHGQGLPKLPGERLTPEVIKAQIAALKAPKVAWREIDWKSCLIDGLKEAREQKKPIIFWIFIDRPADDARC